MRWAFLMTIEVWLLRKCSRTFYEDSRLNSSEKQTWPIKNSISQQRLIPFIWNSFRRLLMQLWDPLSWLDSMKREFRMGWNIFEVDDWRFLIKVNFLTNPVEDFRGSLAIFTGVILLAKTRDANRHRFYSCGPCLDDWILKELIAPRSCTRKPPFPWKNQSWFYGIYTQTRGLQNLSSFLQNWLVLVWTISALFDEANKMACFIWPECKLHFEVPARPTPCSLIANALTLIKFNGEADSRAKLCQSKNMASVLLTNLRAKTALLMMLSLSLKLLLLECEQRPSLTL